jgi:hypothetical protein
LAIRRDNFSCFWPVRPLELIGDTLLKTGMKCDLGNEATRAPSLTGVPCSRYLAGRVRVSL